MTRELSRLLGASEPKFSQSVHELERAAGAPGHDIRLTVDIAQRLRQKIAELGLDPKDTAGPELFRALEERLKSDDGVVRQAIGVVDGSTSNEVVSRVYQFFVKQVDLGTCFAIRTATAKRLLRKKQPKQTMKRLGYRSFDSMLKHETVPRLFAAINMCESATWLHNFREQYARLTPGDFETRPMTLSHPLTGRWQQLSSDFVSETHHNLITLPEIGAIVMLPIDEPVESLAITTILLTVEQINSIKTRSSFTKLQQVRPDFGQLFKQAVVNEPYTSAQLAGQPVPWRMIQRYYARFSDAYHPEVFEPHVQPEDLSWTSGEAILASLEPSLRFWLGTESLGLLHDGQIVSCNALDVALGVCNRLPFGQRIVHFVRDNLWHELMMGYLHQENLESHVHQQLASELASADQESLPEQIEAEAV